MIPILTKNKSHMQLSVRRLLIAIAIPSTFLTSGCRERDMVVGLPQDHHTVKPSVLPTFASLSLYSTDSPFNSTIGPHPEIDPHSPQMIALLVNNSGEFVIMLKQYSSPVYFSDENTPRYDVALKCGSTWELGVSILKDVPIPDWAEPAFDADGAENPPPPGGCGEDSAQDNLMVVLDPFTRCEYDLWQARRTNGQWEASWGNHIEMDSNGVFQKGLSARGSGFAFLGGLIWPDEVKAGKIEHVVVFSYPFTKAGGPVPPATESDGISVELGAIPEGALLQLNPGLNLDSLDLEPYERTISRALQEYGMLLVDSGGESGIGLYAVDPKSVEGNPYEGVLPDEDFPPLSNIPLNEFRVLKLSEQIPNWQDSLGLVESRCGAIE